MTAHTHNFFMEETSKLERTSVGKGTIIQKYCNIYDSTIGKNCKIASYVEIGHASIGDGCKVEAYAFIPKGVTVGNHVFVGAHTAFTNDKFPRATQRHWECFTTVVEDDVSIGAGCVILSGLRIGKGSMIGAGSIICDDVPPKTIVYGEKARVRRTIQ